MSGEIEALTRKQRDAVEAIGWGMRHFGSVVTNRHVRRRTVQALIRKGLAESVGRVQLCDDDGFMCEPERYREGFRLTHAGRDVHKRLLQLT